MFKSVFKKHGHLELFFEHLQRLKLEHSLWKFYKNPLFATWVYFLLELINLILNLFVNWEKYIKFENKRINDTIPHTMSSKRLATVSLSIYHDCIWYSEIGYFLVYQLISKYTAYDSYYLLLWYITNIFYTYLYITHYNKYKVQLYNCSIRISILVNFPVNFFFYYLLLIMVDDKYIICTSILFITLTH